MVNRSTFLKFHLSLLIITFFFTTNAFGQNLRGYGQADDAFYGAFVTEDNNVALCGGRDDFWDAHTWLVVMTQEGEVVLDRVYNDFEFGGTGFDLIEVEGGGYLIGGYSIHGRAQTGFHAILTDDEGEVIWANEYNPEEEEYTYNSVRDVIEMKNDDFILAGYAGRLGIDYGYMGRMVRVNPEGEVVWERNYHGNGHENQENLCAIHSILQSGESILGVGYIYGQGAWIFSASVETGEINWEQTFNYYPPDLDPWPDRPYGMLLKLVSDGDRYFAFGSMVCVDGEEDIARDLLVGFRANGDIFLQRDLDLWPREYFFSEASWDILAAKRHPAGGFVVSAYRNEGYGRPIRLGYIARLDELGSTIWEDTLRCSYLNAFTIKPDGGIAAYGLMDFRREPHNAIRYEVSDHSPSIITRAGHDGETDYERNYEDNQAGFELTVLQGDIVRFWVEAEDWQQDSIMYRWYLDDEIIGEENFNVIEFLDLGQFRLSCRISEDDWATMDSVWWDINVVELYINSHDPSERTVWLAREESCVFSISVRAVEEREVTLNWTLNGEFVSDEDSYEIAPLENRDPVTLVATASNGNADDSVEWSVNLISVFDSWFPESEMISTSLNSVVRFGASLREPLPEGMRLHWFKGNDTVADDSLTVEIEFSEAGRTWVSLGVFNEGNYVEDILWTVDVTASDISGSDVIQPETSIISIEPNPFNSKTTIRYSLEHSSGVSISVFDHTGRNVSELYKGTLEAGRHDVVFDAETLPAGIYFVRLEANSLRQVRKIALVK